MHKEETNINSFVCGGISIFTVQNPSIMLSLDV